MTEEQITAALANKDIRFPVLPVTMLKVNEVMKNPDAGIPELVAVLTQPTIVVRVLQVANSPALRVSRHVRTISEAVAVLGVNLVRNIVVCVTMRDMFSCRDVELARFLEELWQHSM